jgi:hypothetical protein
MLSSYRPLIAKPFDSPARLLVSTTPLFPYWHSRSCRPAALPVFGSSAIHPRIKLSRFSCLLFLPDVLGTASADIRCARHLRPFCFALHCSDLRKAHRERFRSHHKVQGLRLSQTRRKTSRSPKKARPKFGSNQPRVLVPKHSRGGKGKNS